jgi:uncharacterized MAPEG superfamily protein
MNDALHWLAATGVLTALLWLPYGLEMIAHQGLMAAIGNRDAMREPAPWAARCRGAHANAVENLVVFASLLIAATIGGVDVRITAAAAQIYFWARLVHVLSYAAGIVLVRTLAFVGGWIATLWVGWSLLRL